MPSLRLSCSITACIQATEVALIGHGTEAYWAHLARLRVVAEIPAHITTHQTRPALDFWESGTEQQQKALSILERTGASAVVAGSQLSPEGSVPSSCSGTIEENRRNRRLCLFLSR